MEVLMAEEITNTVTNETQTAPVVAEENTVANQEPQVTAPENTNEQPPVENSNQEEVNENQEQQKQPSVEELQSKLKQYEVREEEDRMIREKLGLSDVDQQTFNYMNIDQQIVNEGKQAYLQLCNEYGISADPDKIDASVEALKQTDPRKAFEFEKRFEQLGQNVEYRRNVVQQQNAMYEVNKFSHDYGELLDASPAISNVLKEYISMYGGSGSNMYGQLKSVVDVIAPVFQEAFNAGRQYALQDKARKDTSAVQGGVATQTQVPYNSSHVFTRDEIKRMSSDEFAKYEKQIQQQMIEGKI